MLSWMAWTWPTALVFIGIFAKNVPTVTHRVTQRLLRATISGSSARIVRSSNTPSSGVNVMTLRRGKFSTNPFIA